MATAGSIVKFDIAYAILYSVVRAEPKSVKIIRTSAFEFIAAIK